MGREIGVGIEVWIEIRLDWIEVWIEIGVGIEMEDEF